MEHHRTVACLIVLFVILLSAVNAASNFPSESEDDGIYEERYRRTGNYRIGLLRQCVSLIMRNQRGEPLPAKCQRFAPSRGTNIVRWN